MDRFRIAAAALIAVFIPLPTPSAGAAETWTLRLERGSLTVPATCAIVESTNTRIRCRAPNADKSYSFASLDHLAFDPPTAERIARDLRVNVPSPDSAAQNLDVAFRYFAKQSVKGVEHRVTAADLPRNQLPGKANACKVYTMEQFGKDADIGDLTVFERGILCVTRDASYVVDIAAAAYVYHPGKGQRLPKDAAARLDRVLATFRLR